MKLFECQNCGHPLYFENTRCESCGLRLGYLPARGMVSSLRRVDALKPAESKPGAEPKPGEERESGPELWHALATPPNGGYRFCANAEYDVCNWLIRSENPERFCAACRHNRTIPDLSVAENLTHWRLIEVAKHRLFYTLLKLRLPLATKAEDPDGLAFDFLENPTVGTHASALVLTGHDNG